MTTRQRHTKDYEETKKIIADNILRLMGSQQEQGGRLRSSEALAKELGVTSSMVRRWCNRTVMPNTDYIMAIATAFGVSVNDLLYKHGAEQELSKRLTYSQLLWLILDLQSEDFFSQEGLRDPFIFYLYDKYMTIEMTPTIQPERKERWKNQVYKDFDRPLLPAYLTQYIEVFRWQYSEIEEYDTTLVVFNILQDYMNGKNREKVDNLIARWHENDDNDGSEFPPLTIPWHVPGQTADTIYKMQTDDARRSAFSYYLSDRRKWVRSEDGGHGTYKGVGLQLVHGLREEMEISDPGEDLFGTPSNGSEFNDKDLPW